MLGGAAVGVVAAFLQTLEKLSLIENQGKALACDINSVFSCSNVLNAWQSSVFGFPNAIMCLALFVIFATVALAGFSGGKLSKGFRLGVQFLTLFTLGFGIWYLQQSAYVIHAMCIFCIFCFIGLLFVNGTWLRINADDLPISDNARAKLKKAISSGTDIFGWTVLGLLVTFLVAVKFY